MAVAARRAAFDEYIREGGFPELQFIKNHRDYVNGLVNNILQRDIEERFKIVYKRAFEEMAHHLMNVAPTIVADKSIQEMFSFKSPHTAKNYIGYLKQAYLLVGLRKYSSKSRIRFSGEKIYPIDVALMNKREDAFAGENLGWRLECIVYLELLRRYKGEGKDIFYYSERYGECDFLVCEGRKTVLAVQVSYDISSPKTLKREIAGLILAAKKTGCDNLLLLTDHDYKDLSENGYIIPVRPVYEYALQ